jgi:geranylgeranyl diphosphate synthase, type II
MKKKSKEYELQVNEILADVLNRYIKEDSQVKAGMVYSLLDGGKRLRPQLFMLLLEAYQVDYQKYPEVIAALEMIHTYSLVHDDLPALDNDSMRRGKPATHVRFGEGTAILVGDALLNDAFYVLSNANVDSDKLVEMMRFLTLCTGSNGMILGQCLDIADNQKLDLQLIEKINLNKTAALFIATTTLAGMLVNKSVQEFSKLGLYLGLAFQIQDDMLDITKQTSEIGKNAQSDLANNKKNVVIYLGMDKAQVKVNQYFAKVDDILVKNNLQDSRLYNFIEGIKQRQY